MDRYSRPRRPAIDAHSAIPARAIQVHAVVLQLESVAFHQPLLQLFDFRVDDFEELPARRADKMIVMAVAVAVLVSGGPILKVYLTAQSAFREELERAVDRGIADARMFLPDRSPELVDGDVLLDAEENAQYLLAGFAVAQTFAFYEPFENGRLFHEPFQLMKMTFIINYTFFRAGCQEENEKSAPSPLRRLPCRRYFLVENVSCPPRV
jgi:hypothetical protein